MDWKSIIGSVAPTVATGLFGPAGGLIASIAGRILLGSDKASPDEVKDYVLANQTPEVFAKLKEIEASVTVKLKELEVDLERIAAGDRDSARRREIETGSWAPAILAGILLIGYFAVVGAFISGQVVIPKEYELVFGNLLGTLSSGVGLALGYYYGSSVSSKAKTDAMAAAARR